ncbi:hypothetical protein AB3X91_35250, partial [Paraburkholderia sp. BR14263]|uniref:hypothetical protein n=1 Tax=unclassified Paraburkholderia TaxID=2615204 RepID=UPI0034CF1AAC
SWQAPQRLQQSASLPALKNTTSVNSQNTTLGRSPHIKKFDNLCYVKSNNVHRAHLLRREPMPPHWRNP